VPRAGEGTVVAPSSGVRLPCPASLLLLLALGAAASAAPRPRVRGLDGQAHLRLDLGHAVAARPLARVRAGAPRLSAIEKARLDARRIVFASSLDRPRQLERLVAVVQHRLPLSSDARYERISRAEVAQLGEARLSRLVAGRAGLCRERAFLLAALLKETGTAARVRYGVLYDREQRYLGGHAWVEATLDGERRILDPSLPAWMPPARPLLVSEEVAGGGSRRVRALATPDLLYLPTPDLRMER
jgi:hypothetical protein